MSHQPSRRLIIIRHGHRVKRAGGEADNGLSEIGRKQADALLEVYRAKFQRQQASLYSSPKRRCIETLIPLAEYLDTPIIEDNSLLESSTQAEVVERISDFRRIYSQAEQPLIIVCTHGDWIPQFCKVVFGASIQLEKGGWIELRAEEHGLVLDTVIQDPALQSSLPEQIGENAGLNLKHFLKSSAGFPSRFKSGEDVAVDLSQALASAAGDYCRHLGLLNNGCTTKRVHDFRVSSRQFLAALTLAADIHRHPKLGRLKKQVKRQLDKLSDLRDLQVLQHSLEDLRSRNRWLSPVARRVGESEKHERHRAENALKKLETSRFIKNSRNLLERIDKTLSTLPPEFCAGKAEKSVNRLFKRLQVCADRLDPEEAAGFHRLRIAVKKWRYTVEQFIDQRQFFDRAYLEQVHALQHHLGEMQDRRVLIRLLKREKTKSKDERKSLILRLRIDQIEAMHALFGDGTPRPAKSRRRPIRDGLLSVNPGKGQRQRESGAAVIRPAAGFPASDEQTPQDFNRPED